MNILEIIENIKSESGRTDIPDRTILRWLNAYKLDLQRKRRWFLAENTSQIVMTENNRSTDLPSNFLQMIAIRRLRSEIAAQTQDFYGNRHQVLKQTILSRWTRREAFLDRFPTNRLSDGGLYIGTSNDYMLQGRSIIWGPIPSASESLFVDYYGALLPYDDTNYKVDDFTELYYDGLFNRGMEMVFKLWIPDEKKAKQWMVDRLESEKSLHILQIHREHPMESDINIPDN